MKIQKSHIYVAGGIAGLLGFLWWHSKQAATDAAAQAALDAANAQLTALQQGASAGLPMAGVRMN